MQDWSLEIAHRCAADARARVRDQETLVAFLWDDNSSRLPLALEILASLRQMQELTEELLAAETHYMTENAA